MSAADLDDAMNKRRIELRLRWTTVAQRAGMDASNLRRIRQGDIDLTEFAAPGIDSALQWPDGAAWRLFHHREGEPMPEPAGPEASPVEFEDSTHSEEDSQEPDHAESPVSMKAGDESEPDTGSDATREEVIRQLELAISNAQELLETLLRRQRDAG